MRHVLSTNTQPHRTLVPLSRLSHHRSYCRPPVPSVQEENLPTLFCCPYGAARTTSEGRIVEKPAHRAWLIRFRRQRWRVVVHSSPVRPSSFPENPPRQNCRTVVIHDVTVELPALQTLSTWLRRALKTFAEGASNANRIRGRKRSAVSDAMISAKPNAIPKSNWNTPIATLPFSAPQGNLDEKAAIVQPTSLVFPL